MAGDQEQKNRFFNVPVSADLPSPTTEQKSLWNRQRELNAAKFEKEHPIKAAIGKGIAGTIDSVMGFLGLPGVPDTKARQFGELLNAGLPFAAYKAKGLDQVYHGTQRLFDKFNPAKYDTSDVLGWLTHFAESPDYANQYAMGIAKGLKPINYAVATPEGIIPKEIKPEELQSYFSGGETDVIPRMIPAQIDAKNVLDLVDPHIDDLSQALASVEPERRKDIIRNFKFNKSNPNNVKYNLSDAHLGQIPESELESKPATFGLSDKLRLQPEEFENSPFDAIRYFDTKHKSWAVPEKTPILGSFKGYPGAPLNEAAERRVSPIKMIRQDEVKTGNLPVSNKKIMITDHGGYTHDIDWYSKVYGLGPQEVANKAHKLGWKIQIK